MYIAKEVAIISDSIHHPPINGLRDGGKVKRIGTRSGAETTGRRIHHPPVDAINRPGERSSRGPVRHGDNAPTPTPLYSVSAGPVVKRASEKSFRPALGTNERRPCQ